MTDIENLDDSMFEKLEESKRIPSLLPWRARPI